MFNVHDITRDEFMLDGMFADEGYDWWWHSFTGISEKTGEERAFFIEFFTCNPELGGDKPVLGQKAENKKAGKKPSYLMVKAGCWGEEAAQIHRFFGWKNVKLRAGAPFSIEAEDCYLSETETRGSVSVFDEEVEAYPEYMCDSGEMTWKLSINKKIAFNVGYGASKPFRDLKAFEMYWHAEGMKTLYSGYVYYNGVKYNVSEDTCYGYADKNWGDNFTSPWVWLSSNCLTSNITGKELKNSVFDIGGGRPKAFGIEFDRKLLGALYYEGREFEFNFSKFWTLPRTRFYCEETDTEIIWHVNMDNADSMIRTRFRCKKKDMLLVNYESPDGMKRHNRLWNGGNGEGRILLYKKTGEGRLKLLDDISVTHLGCEYGEYCEKGSGK
ncbi:MAG: hypothetical protein IJ796_05730 [Lachnospiraceae bacterium]|nr:hypothetical protein [Lachnospiraceae bacterium]